MNKVTMRRVWNQATINALAYQARHELFNHLDGSDWMQHDEMMVCSNGSVKHIDGFNCDDVCITQSKLPCNKCRMMWFEPDAQIMY